MPHSLRVRLRNLKHKGELSEDDVNRIITALDYYENSHNSGLETVKKLKDEALRRLMEEELNEQHII